MTDKNLHSTQNDFLLYKSPDGDVKVSVLLKNETIWLSSTIDIDYCYNNMYINLI
jgi:hypothetical protein